QNGAVGLGRWRSGFLHDSGLSTGRRPIAAGRGQSADTGAERRATVFSRRRERARPSVQQLNYLGPRELAWREAPAPKLDSDRAALVRPLAVATCDLDALIVAGVSPFRAPFALGHECVAE